MTADSIVRLAKPEDRPQLLKLCRILANENAFRKKINWQKVDDVLDRYFQAKGGLIGVIGPVGGLEAASVLITTQLWYTDEWILEELFNFVHPAHRKSEHAKKLIMFTKGLADRLGVPLVTGIFTTKRTEAKCRFYDRHLERAGAYYIYRPPGFEEQPALAAAE